MDLYENTWIIRLKRKEIMFKENNLSEKGIEINISD